MTTEQQTLLPIGSRVTHFDGGPNTHGKGTIVAYNGVEPSAYLKTNFSDAIQLANDAGMLGGIISMVYDKNRCPYIVQWDIREGDSDHDKEMRAKYPRGYCDVYETDSVRAYPHNTGHVLNIFANGWIRVMSRQWLEKNKKWGPWLICPEDLYLKRHTDNRTKQEWQFCVRPLPKVEYRHSPKDGSFVPLTISEESSACDHAGYYPPMGIFVEFYTHRDQEPKLGLTAQLQAMGPWSKSETVFVVVEEDEQEVFFIKEVRSWRELIDRERFTPSLMEYVGEWNESWNRDFIAREG